MCIPAQAPLGSGVFGTRVFTFDFRRCCGLCCLEGSPVTEAVTGMLAAEGRVLL